MPPRMKNPVVCYVDITLIRLQRSNISYKVFGIITAEAES